MNIEPDGHLSLHHVDLVNDVTVKEIAEITDMRYFKCEAQIAAAYARAAGHRVTFVRPGCPVLELKPTGSTYQLTNLPNERSKPDQHTD